MNNSAKISLSKFVSFNIIVATLLCLLLLIPYLAISRAATDRFSDKAEKPAAEGNINSIYGNLPLSFEANRAQTDERVKFVARASGYTLFLKPDEAVFKLRNADLGTRNE